MFYILCTVIWKSSLQMPSDWRQNLQPLLRWILITLSFTRCNANHSTWNFENSCVFCQYGLGKPYTGEIPRENTINWLNSFVTFWQKKKKRKEMVCSSVEALGWLCITDLSRNNNTDIFFMRKHIDKHLPDTTKDHFSSPNCVISYFI